MKIKYCIIGAALAAMLPVSANAAIITKSYQVTSIFTKGPLSKVTTSFDVTFDTSLMKTENIVISKYVTDGGNSFAAPSAQYGYVAPYDDPIYSRPEARYIIVFGGDQPGMLGNSYDFLINFGIDITGKVVNSNSSYAANTGSIIYGSASVRDVTPAVVVIPPSSETPVAAIPEASTWMMMMVGFGLIGAATRYRRKGVQVRYA